MAVCWIFYLCLFALMATEVTGNAESLNTPDPQKEDWKISTEVRSKRSQIDGAQWLNLSSIEVTDGADDELMRDSMSDHNPLSRVERDLGSGDVRARMNLTVNWNLTNQNIPQFEYLTGEAMQAYLQSYPAFYGKSFNISNVTIERNTVEMYVTAVHVSDSLKTLAQALLDLAQNDTLVINGTAYNVSSPLLESLTTGVLQSAVCFLCAAYQTCVQDCTQTDKWFCRLFDDNFYPYGAAQGDSSLASDIEDAAAEVYVEFSFPYGDKLVETIWISVNGIVSFEDKFTSFSPTRLPVTADDGSYRDLLAVYWADLDLSSSDGKAQVFYQYYTRSASNSMKEMQVFLKAGSDIAMYAQEFDTFSPTDVVVVTWDGIPPWPANSSTEARVTFQCIIISDGTVTYAMYLYGQGAMHFDPVYELPVEIGWGTVNLDNSRGGYYDFDTVIGNTNLCGRWLFKIGEKPNSRRKCLEWIQQNMLLSAEINRMNQIIPACPCSETAALLSVFWIKSLEQDGCFDIFPIFGHYGRRCCYRQDGSSGFENRIPVAGSLQRYTPFYGDVVNHELEDTLPKQWCCYESNLCLQYYITRPTIDCRPRTTERSLFFGDPHITTLDNLTYTFNGLGEFTVLQVDVTEAGRQVHFILQGRTCFAKSSLGGISKATVFCALALKTTDGSSLMVEISPTGKSMAIYVNGNDYSLQFQAAANFRAFQGGIAVQRVNDSLKVSTLDEIGLTITLHDGILDFTIELYTMYANVTKGLVGNFNGDTKDDFMFPNGSRLMDTSERSLFNYAWAWAVNKNSVFAYVNGLNTFNFSDPFALPPFLDEANDKDVDIGEGICGDPLDRSCIYDYIATKDEKFALRTKVTKTEYVETEKIISNNPPVIMANLVLQVTINQPTILSMTSFDTDNDNIRFIILDEPDSGYFRIINQSNSADISTTLVSVGATANLGINVTLGSTKVVSLDIVASDSRGLQSEVASFEFIVCNLCSFHGLCNFTRTMYVSYFYSLAGCECDAPWSGDNCERDKNGCSDIPCPDNTTCTDVPASEEDITGIAYTCSDCPTGLIKNGIKCEDINECDNGSNPCVNANCNNTDGSFNCNCISGYRQINHTTCEDINECTDMKHSCPQVCVNTLGFYECECQEGFNKSGAMGCSCVKTEFDPCGNLTHNCSYGCRNATGVAQCFCETGKQVAADGLSCEDIDECKENLCSQNCTNTYGSYKCSCYSGYILADDGLSCNTCPQNHFGVQCKQKCECRGHGKYCDNVRGCICQDNWEGKSCEVDVQECRVNPNSCPPERTCINTPGSYKCVCVDGYSDINGTCYNINECNSPRDNLCPQKCADKTQCPQVCEDNEGSYTCLCNQGYQKLPGNNTCHDIDECALGISDCQHVCNNAIGSFNCKCRQGYILTDDRKTCIFDNHTDLEPCHNFNVSCSFACNLVNDMPRCYCPLGFLLGIDNSSCIDINECMNTSLCTDICENTNGSYTCSCHEGKRLLNDHRSCMECDQNHWGPDCKTLCNCHPKGVMTCNAMTGCECIDGWSGTHCDEDIDECSASILSCPNAHHCVNTPGFYMCTCNSGFHIDNDTSMTCVDTDECAADVAPCGHICTNIFGSYTCSCFPGFISNGSDCTDFDECSVPELSNCDQRCRNTQGGFACDCFQGYVLNTTTRNTCYCDGNQSCNGTHNCSHLDVVQDQQEKCVCHPGFYLDPTDNTSCKDINECMADNDTCINGSCNNTEGNFNCTCDKGSKLADDHVTCTVCDSGLYGTNCSETCRCNMSYTKECLAADGVCVCYEGWAGPDCSTDVDECTSSSNVCGVNATCVNSPGSFRCVCNVGFFRTSEKCEACDTIHYGQDCKLKCQCDRAHTHNCDDTNGECICNQGWMGKLCDVDIDECQNASVCPDPHDQCHNINGSYECLCDNGYERFDPAERCLDVNECLNPTLNTCEKPCVCNNTEGYFECIYQMGFNNVKGQCIAKISAFTVDITLSIYEETDARIFDNSTSQFRTMAQQVSTALLDTGRESIGFALFAVEINYLRSGSLIVDTVIEIDQRYSNNPARDVSVLLLYYLRLGKLNIGNTTANVTRISVVNVILTQDTSPCVVFNLFSSCGADEQCQVVNGSPECQTENGIKKLIIGLAVGIPLFLILTVAVTVLVYCLTRKRQPEATPSPPSVDESIFVGNLAPRKSWSVLDDYPIYSAPDYSDRGSNVRDEDTKLLRLIQGKQPRATSVVLEQYPVYAPPDYSDSDREEGEEDNGLPQSNQREQPEETPGDALPQAEPKVDESAGIPQYGYFWNYMTRILEPHKDLHIQRPQFGVPPSQAQSSQSEQSNHETENTHSKKRPDSQA